MYAFCLQLDSCEKLESECHESEFSCLAGSDTEYIPPQTESSCSDEDVNILHISSDEDLEGVYMPIQEKTKINRQVQNKKN